MTEPESESYLVFARRYRPRAFEEVVGQEHVARTLRNAIREGRIGHAYLFAGPRGVGKTSMARIFAKALDCAKGPTEEACDACELCRSIQDGSDTDVVEMDAASNRSVEDARALREGVRYAPLRARFKIYIIDEAHMLTREAFNTLLKTLEEPPPRVKFVFATTEIHKLPDTIVSRCQQFDFRRITSADIVKRLKQVAGAEKLRIDDGVFAAVARAARGSMRDAESILDQLVTYRRQNAGPDDVAALLGAASGERLDALVEAVSGGDAGAALRALDAVFAGGIDSAAFADQLIEHVRTLMVLKACGAGSGVVDLPDAMLEAAGKQASAFTLEALLYHLQLLFESRRRIREGLDPRIVLEAAVVKMARAADLVSLTEILGAGSRAQAAPSTRNSPAAAPPPAVEPSDRPPVAELAETREDADPAPFEGEVTLAGLQSRWPRVVAEVRRVSPIPGAVLEHGKPTQLLGDEVEISLTPAFSMHRDQLDLPKNRQIIEAALQKVFGRRLGAHVVVARGGPEPAAPLFPGSAPTRSDLASDTSVRNVLERWPGSKIVGIE